MACRAEGIAGMNMTVAIAGLGAIGLPVARALDEGIVGLRLIGVAMPRPVKARARLADFQTEPPLMDFEELAEADIVVEAAPASVFERIALPALQAGRIFVPASAGALLPRMHLARLAIQTGARIIVPTGALSVWMRVRAAAEGPIESVSIETRKPPIGLAGAPHLVKHGIEVMELTEPLLRVRWQRPGCRRGFPRQCQRGGGAGACRNWPDPHQSSDLGRSTA